MKKINILIMLALVSLLAATSASANACTEEDCKLQESIYCGTLEGEYTAKDAAGNEITGLGLTAEFRADFDSREVRILSVKTSGSTPAIMDETLRVRAVLNKDNKIVVTASGKCGMGNRFSGTMLVDPCEDFKVISNSGEVTVKRSNGGKTKYKLTGVFDIEAEECCDLPEGIYCGTLEGTYFVKDGSIPGNFVLKADFKADFDQKKIKILNVDTTGSYPEIDDETLEVKAKLNKDKTITVTAKGYCMDGNKFNGEMVIDPCNEFEVISSTGWVKVVINQQGQQKKVNLEGEFEITSLEECSKLPDGIYCGTIEGTYTATALDGTTIPGLGLAADFQVDFDSGNIEILNVETTEGSMINDDSLTVTATFNEKKKIIRVVAKGKCMENNRFKGVMKIDPCNDFEVISNSGWVIVKDADGNKIKYTVTGDFGVDIWNCDQPCDLPEGTYCGILEGAYIATTPTGDELGPFMLKADVKADFDSGKIEILNVNTEGSNPAINEINVEATLDKETGIITVTADGTCMAGNVFHGEMKIDACDEFKITENSGWVKVRSPVEMELELAGNFELDIDKCEETCELPTEIYCGTIDGKYPVPKMGDIGLTAYVEVDFDKGVVEVSNIKTTGKDMEIVINEPVSAQLSKDTGMLTVSTTGTIGSSFMTAPFSTEMLVQTCNEEFTFMKNEATVETTLFGDITVQGTDFTINLGPCGITPP